MSTKIYEDSQNYTATVIKLPAKQEVKGFDNLVAVEVFGNTCLISKDSDETQLYLFIPAGSQISPKFAHYNNLYRDVLLNQNQAEKGFFDGSGRVKGLKLKGVISNGFVIPLEAVQTMLQNLVKCNVNLTFKEGDEFNEIDGYEVCRKYFIPVPYVKGEKQNKEAKINNKLSELLIPNQFRFHTETSHLAKHLDKFTENDIIAITDKWHGSSCILSKVLVNKKLNKLQKLWNKVNFLPKYPTKELGFIYSSGKPKSNLPKGIEGVWRNENKDYYESNIWERAAYDYKYLIEEGISLYAEIVGYDKLGKCIQKNYDYGCKPGEYKLIVYRITYTKPNGEVIEFTWSQIKEYCNKYKIEHVKEFFYGSINTFYNNASELSVGEQLFLTIKDGFNLEQQDKYCEHKVPSEGAVIRIDSNPKFEVYKLKSKLFTLVESNAEETNIEENQ